MSSLEKEDWIKAMKTEFKQLKNKDVWDLVDRTEDMKVISNRWVYDVKRHSEGIIIHYRARLVAGGHKQIEGVDYEEVFSPVVDFSIIRLFFAIFVSYLKWSHYQINVNGAYLYGRLEHDVYVTAKGISNRH